jgi:hypothetical protein
MIKQYKARALVWSIAGIITQGLGLAGVFSGRLATEELNPAFAGVLLLLIGTAILSFGLYFYAQAKNRRPAWALAGLLCLPGFFILHFLSDNSKPMAKKPKRS